VVVIREQGCWWRMRQLNNGAKQVKRGYKSVYVYLLWEKSAHNKWVYLLSRCWAK
jgi:hypothetical protein